MSYQVVSNATNATVGTANVLQASVGSHVPYAGMTPAQSAIQVRTLAKQLSKMLGNMPAHPQDDDEEEDGAKDLDYDDTTGYTYTHALQYEQRAKEANDKRSNNYEQLELAWQLLEAAIVARKPTAGKEALNKARMLTKRLNADAFTAFEHRGRALKTFTNLRGKALHRLQVEGPHQPDMSGAQKLAEQIYNYAQALPVHDHPAQSDLDITIRAIIAILRARHPAELDGITQAHVAENMAKEGSDGEEESDNEHTEDPGF